VVGALFAVLTACSPSASITVTLSPASGDLVLGGELVVVVTVARSGGASADIALAATGLPADVSAAFAPATLGGGATTATMTLSAAPGAAQGTATVTVTATGAGLSASRTFEVTVTDLTVTGTVVGSFGQGLAGISVSIQGQPTVVTAADGSFTVDGVSVPYDVAIASGADQWGNVYQGLTTATPELFSLASVASAVVLPTATVQGTLDGLVPADHVTKVCVEGIDEAVYGCANVNAGTDTYTITANWVGGGTISIRVRAVEYSLADFEPVAVTGASASGVTSMTEGGVSVVDLVIGAPVPPSQFPVTVTTTFTPTRYIAGAITHLNPRFSLGLGTKSSVADPVITALTPFYSGSTYTVIGGAFGANNAQSLRWHLGLQPGDSVTIATPTPPASTLPADGATGASHSTTFSAGNPEGGVLNFMFSPQFGVTGPTYLVTTTATSVTIPDLTSLGLSLPAASTYIWSVYGTPDSPDVDTALTVGNLRGYVELAYSLSLGGPGPTEEGSISVSESRTVTTQP
jgi:hypothetical protein